MVKGTPYMVVYDDIYDSFKILNTQNMDVVAIEPFRSDEPGI